MPCQPIGLSSDPGMACSLGSGQSGPARHQAESYLCWAKKTVFVLCRRASAAPTTYRRGRDWRSCASHVERYVAVRRRCTAPLVALLLASASVVRSAPPTGSVLGPRKPPTTALPQGRACWAERPSCSISCSAQTWRARLPPAHQLYCAVVKEFQKVRSRISQELSTSVQCLTTPE